MVAGQASAAKRTETRREGRGASLPDWLVKSYHILT
jgi:hypothetical protein